MKFTDTIARLFGGPRATAGAAAQPSGNGYSPAAVVEPTARIDPMGVGAGLTDSGRAESNRPDSNRVEPRRVHLDGVLIEAEGSPGAALVESKPAGRASVKRAQLVAELQRNYSEVLGIVRKVDGHLDEQQHRADRMLAIAEQTARKLDHLPELAAQTGRVADAISKLVELTRDGQSQGRQVTERLAHTAIQQLEAAQQQTAALQHVRSEIQMAGEAERELAQSVGAFRESLTGVSRATSDLGSAITSMRQADADRERELADLVRTGQRSFIFAVLIIVLLAIGTLTAVLGGAI